MTITLLEDLTSGTPKEKVHGLKKWRTNPLVLRVLEGETTFMELYEPLFEAYNAFLGFRLSLKSVTLSDIRKAEAYKPEEELLKLIPLSKRIKNGHLGRWFTWLTWLETISDLRRNAFLVLFGALIGLIFGMSVAPDQSGQSLFIMMMAGAGSSFALTLYMFVLIRAQVALETGISSEINALYMYVEHLDEILGNSRALERADNDA